jgi:hypothetical protein
MILSTHGIVGSQIVQATTLLDLYPNAAAAYSLRLLRVDYTGSAIRVRRASDNTEQNIGFTLLGGLDTSALTTFCSGTNGFVTTWYDQSGNSRNATQATAANQPQIVSSGSVILDNGKPTLKFDGTNDQIGLGTFLFLGSQARTMIGVYKPNTTPSRAHQLFGQNGSNVNGNWCLINFLNISSQDPGFFGFAADLGANLTTPNLLQKIAQFYYTGTIGSLYKNNTLIESKSISLNNLIDNTYNIGNRLGAVENANANIQEVINWGLDQSSNRTGIELNINTYYGIY